MPRRLLAVASFLPLSALASPARPDELAFTLGSDGQLSTWLAAGPLRARGPKSNPLASPGPLAGVTPEAGARAQTPDGTKTWAPFGSRDVWTDLDELPGGGDVAYVACVFESARATRATLSIATNRGATVWLGSQAVYQRTDEGLIRQDFARVPIEIPAGRTTLLLRVPKTAPRNFGAFVRLLDEHLAPLHDVTVRLPGVSLDAALAAFGVLEVRREPTPDGFELAAAVSFPAGGPVAPNVPLAVSLGSDEARATFDAPSRGRVSLRVRPSRDALLTVAVTLGGARTTHPTPYKARRHEALALAARGLALAEGHVPASGLDSVRYNAQRLADLVATGDTDGTHLDAVAEEVAGMGEALLHRQDPYQTLRGALRKAYWSALDGTLQPYSVYVPPNYRTDRAWPLVVVLHGMRGTPHRELRYTFGFDLEDNESKEHADRYLPNLPNPGMIVVSAHGRGDASFKSAGEVDVRDAISAVVADYRVDPDRVYITGPSMGGIGSGGIPLRNPTWFAAASPLCGYHSYRVYNTGIGRPRAPYEDFLLGVFSNADWAENGLHLPMRIVHGTRDSPRYSKVLVDRYEALRYDVRFDLLEAGHNVWGATYANGDIFRWFRGYVRDPMPRRVVLRSYRLRHRSNLWVAVDDAEDYGALVEVEATAAEGNRIDVRTRNVAAFTLDPRAPLVDRARAVKVAVDGGAPIEVAGGAPLSFVRGDSGWAAGRPDLSGIRKRPGLAGPIHDMQYEPVTFVYGTHDPAQTAINRHLAHVLREVRDNATATYPVIPDTALTPEIAANRSLALIGNPASNSVLARIADRLPIHFEPGAIVAGGRRHEGAEVGTMFVHPNPENPDRYVLVVAGVTEHGTALADHLPELVPDWVIFDRGVIPAQGMTLIHGASFRDAGFFDRSFRLAPRHE